MSIIPSTYTSYLLYVPTLAVEAMNMQILLDTYSEQCPLDPIKESMGQRIHKITSYWFQLPRQAPQ